MLTGSAGSRLAQGYLKASKRLQDLIYSRLHLARKHRRLSRVFLGFLHSGENDELSIKHGGPRSLEVRPGLL